MGLIIVGAVSIILGAGVAAQQRAEMHDMQLVGYNDLQARSAYQPVIHKQGDRWIAYIGHHGGTQPNPLTGKAETNGTSIVDVLRRSTLAERHAVLTSKWSRISTTAVLAKGAVT